MIDTIYVGDSYPIQVSWVVPSAENPYQTTDAVISEAEVTVIRNKDRKIIIERVAATISGNETSYTLHNIETSGLHSAYVSVIMNDDTRLTKALEFYVK